jgi:HEAT repeat protein
MKRLSSSRRVRLGAALVALAALFWATGAQAQNVSRKQIREWTKLLESDDAARRSVAATSLLASEDENALQALLEALQAKKPRDVRICVITAFGVRGDDRAVAMMTTALDDPDEAVRASATTALQTINTPAAIRHLVEAAGDAKRNADVRARIIQILAGLRTIDAIPPLIGLLSDPNEPVAKAARTALERLTLRNFATVQEWEAWWKENSKLTREEMLEVLVALTADRVKWLAQQNERLLLQMLAERKDRADPAPLVAALTESDSVKVKLFAVKELTALKGKAAVDALVKALKDGEPSVRAAAADGLGGFGDTAAVAALTQSIFDNSPAVRTASAKALGALKSRDATPALCNRLTDAVPEVAVAAATALAELADPASVEELIKAVVKPNAPTALVAAAAGALGKVRDPRAAGTFIALLSNKEENIRWSAVDGLGGVGGRAAVQPLSAVALKDPNPQIREAAVAALAKIGDVSALNTLVDALSDDQKRIADLALLSLLKLSETDAKLPAQAIDKLLAAKRYAQAEAVVAGAVEQLSRGPDGAERATALRLHMAAGLMAVREYARAKAILDDLVKKSPREADYVRRLGQCLTELRDYDALLALMTQARRSIPDQSATWWQETAKTVELMSGAGAGARVIAAVDALEKESPEMGGPAVAAQLIDLRTKARAAKTPAPG